MRRKWTEQDRQLILANLDKTDAEIAVLMGVTRFDVTKYRKRAGIAKVNSSHFKKAVVQAPITRPREWGHYLTYNPDSGELRWKSRPETDFLRKSDHERWNILMAGSRAECKEYGAGGVENGSVFRLHRKTHRVHRVIWEMTHGPIPEGMVIDHINGDPFDNRVCNLRLATPMQNAWNSKRSAKSRHLVRGVRRIEKGGQWAAQITLNGKTINLGKYPTKGLAAVAYAKASLRMHGTFSPLARTA